MERQHAEWQTCRHQQLDLRGAPEHVRAKSERDRRDRRGATVAHQIPDQVIAARGAKHHRQHEDEVEREVRIARRPVRWNRQRAGAQVGFRVDERPLMRIENIGVEHMRWIDDQRARHPRYVPDPERPIEAVDASDVRHLCRKGERQHDGQERRGTEDCSQLANAARAQTDHRRVR